MCEPECRLVPRKVVDQDCTEKMLCTEEEKVVPREVCRPVERQECTPVSKKECEMQPVEMCKKVSFLRENSNSLDASFLNASSQ